MKRWARLDAVRRVITTIDRVDFATLQAQFPDFADKAVEVALTARDNQVVDQQGNPVAEPAPERIIDTGDFLDRFTNAELTALRANNTAFNFLLRKLIGRQREGVNLDGAGTAAYLDSLVTASIITAQRKIEILG